MGFSNRIYCKYTSIKGIVALYNDYLFKDQYMIQKKKPKRRKKSGIFYYR
jgi:hypothetical protein